MIVEWTDQLRKHGNLLMFAVITCLAITIISMVAISRRRDD